MEAAASVIAIVEIVGRVSVSAASFMRDIKEARRDIIQVRKEMLDLSTVLRMVAEDLDYHSHSSSSRADNMPHSQQHIVGIAHSCGTVLLKIETVLRKGRSRLAWVTSGKQRADRLRERLETCKLSLDVALDCRTMVVVHDIKVDSTRIVSDLSTIQRDVALLLGKVDNIERKTMEDQESDDTMDLPGCAMLDRFLNDCRSDAQTVLDSIEYQQDEDFEDARPPQVQAEAQDIAADLAPSHQWPTLSFRNSLGSEHSIPLEQCRTWTQMEEIIKCSYPPGSADAEEIKNGRYTLHHDDQDVLLASWDDFVRHGLRIALKVWECDPIEFKDAVGRKFNFPWSMAKTWKGTEAMIKQAFLHVEVIGYEVRQGYHDLIGPDDSIISPVLWKQVVKPGMSISMKIWPEGSYKPLSGQAGTRQAQYTSNSENLMSIQERRPPASEVEPGADRRLKPTGRPASQQVRQKQHTSQGPSNPKRIVRSLVLPHAPRHAVVKNRPAKTTGLPDPQPLQGSSHSRNARQKST